MRNEIADRVLRSLRAKALRVVDEVVARYHHQQRAELDRLQANVGDLRRELDGLRGELNAQRGQTDHQSDRIMNRISDFEHRARRDLEYHSEWVAAAASAEFVRSELAHAAALPDMVATLEHGLALAPHDGLALEFGVFSGTTLKIIAAARAGRDVFGFDSFQGLPESWRSGFPAGAFRKDGLPDVPGAELVIGWFHDTLPGFLAEHPGPVDFLHVDSDLYSSAKTVFDQVGPRLRAGSVIVFDEYFNYPGWQQHEHQAWSEFVADNGVEFDYEAYTVDHEQLVVRITKIH